MTNRRKFIKETSLLGAITMLGSSVKSFAIAKPNLEDELIIGHSNHKYKVAKDWAKIGVNDTPIFNCHEMVQDHKGCLIMLGDNVHNNVLVFDKAGKLLDNWGNMFPGGHGLSIGGEGSDQFLMLTDCGYYQDKTGKWGKQAGQVVKTTLDGRLHFALGHPKTIGVYTNDMLFMPTETAVAPNGDIYVADGYGSDFIIQYDANGKYIRHFGGRNNANPDHNLKEAHGVCVDTRP